MLTHTKLPDVNVPLLLILLIKNCIRVFFLPLCLHSCQNWLNQRGTKRWEPMMRHCAAGLQTLFVVEVLVIRGPGVRKNQIHQGLTHTVNTGGEKYSRASSPASVISWDLKPLFILFNRFSVLSLPTFFSFTSLPVSVFNLRVSASIVPFLLCLGCGGLIPLLALCRRDSLSTTWNY